MITPLIITIFALGLIWFITTNIHKHKYTTITGCFTVAKALQNVDAPCILILMGTLSAAASLQLFSLLKEAADIISHTLKNNYLKGLLSAIVNNKPLVVASQNRCALLTYTTNPSCWEFAVLIKETVGRIIIISTAAIAVQLGIE
jgi:hypothetical protein